LASLDLRAYHLPETAVNEARGPAKSAQLLAQRGLRRGRRSGAEELAQGLQRQQDGQWMEARRVRAGERELLELALLAARQGTGDRRRRPSRVGGLEGAAGELGETQRGRARDLPPRGAGS